MIVALFNSARLYVSSKIEASDELPGGFRQIVARGEHYTLSKA